MRRLVHLTWSDQWKYILLNSKLIKLMDRLSLKLFTICR